MLRVVYAKDLEPIKHCGHIPSGEHIIQQIASTTDTVTLNFSCGKDSIATWLAIYGKFKKIIPVYFYPAPDLEFVEKSLQYYEDFFQCRIYRLPHPSMYRMLRNYVFQPPERMEIIDKFQIPNPSHEELRELLLLNDLAMKPADIAKVYCAVGVRATDNLTRYTSVKKYGPINHKNKTFWPVWDWKKAYMVERMQAVQVKLPPDYEMFGRSFDGLNHDYLDAVRRRFPRDYERIREWFPLVEFDTYRRQLHA